MFRGGAFSVGPKLRFFTRIRRDYYAGALMILVGLVAAQDARHNAQLLRALEQEVVPTYYDGSPPARWLDLVRRSLRVIGPRFAAERMVDDYARRMYVTPSSARR